MVLCTLLVSRRTRLAAMCTLTFCRWPRVFMCAWVVQLCETGLLPQRLLGKPETLVKLMEVFLGCFPLLKALRHEPVRVRCCLCQQPRAFGLRACAHCVVFPGLACAMSM